MFCGICGTSIIPQQTPPPIPQQSPQQPLPVQPIIIQQPMANNNCCDSSKKKQKIYIERKPRSCMFDIFMLLITGGLWAIWMFIRR